MERYSQRDDNRAKAMLYDLDEIERTCLEYGLRFLRTNESELEVEIIPSVRILFANHRELEEDTYLGFVDTPWHSHGKLMLMTSEDTFLEYSPVDLIHALMKKEILIISEHLDGKVNDRWLHHRLDKIDVKDLGNGEVLCICSCSMNNGRTVDE